MSIGSGIDGGFLAFYRGFFAQRMTPPLLLFLLAVGFLISEGSAVLLERGAHPGTTAAAAISFTSAFVLLRITDDIDDEGGGGDRFPHGRVEGRLAVLGLLVLCVLVVTGWLSGTLPVLLLATLSVPVASFVVRPRLAAHPTETLRVRSTVATALLALVYEGAPAAIIVALPLALTDPLVPPARLALTFALAGLFWVGYETFKLGRVTVRPGWHPYGLGAFAHSTILTLFAVAGTAAATVLGAAAFFPVVVVVALGAVLLGVALFIFIVVVTRGRPVPSTPGRTCLDTSVRLVRFVPLTSVVVATLAATFLGRLT